MICICPVTTPINKSEVDYFNDKVAQELNKYTNFLNTMLVKGYTRKQIDDIYIENYGEIPEHVEKIYECYIIAPSLKLTLNVKKNNNYNGSNRKYEVINNRSLYIESLDHTRKIKKVYDDNNKVKIILEKNIDNTEKGGYFINKEDRPWLTSLTVDKILSQLSIKLKEDKDIIFNSFNNMEAYEFDFKDEAFKNHLYDLINEKFIQIESKLE